MGDKLIFTGVGGNLGGEAARVIQELVPAERLVFCGSNPAKLAKFEEKGIETRVVDFNHKEGLAEAFADGEKVLLVSMPFVGPKRKAAHANVVDAAKEAGVRQIVYTSVCNAADDSNPSVERHDHIWTENYIKDAGLDYVFMRNSQYAEAMITNYFTYVKGDGVLKNNQGDGLMAYISRKDCAKAAAYAMYKDLHEAIVNCNGPELMTISKFIEYGNQATGNNVSYQAISDEENYAVFDAMGVPRTTDGEFLEGSEAPFSSEGMVTFGQAIREGKMDTFTDDFEKLTGDKPMSVLYMFEHEADFQIGERNSTDA